MAMPASLALLRPVRIGVGHGHARAWNIPIASSSDALARLARCGWLPRNGWSDMSTIRPFTARDDLEALTALLHRAYARQLRRGLRFQAAHQSSAVTAERIGKGTCYLLEKDGTLIGTITIDGPDPASAITAYRDPRTWTISQFGVDPDHVGKGHGRALHRVAIDHALRRDGAWLALDTSDQAQDLIAMYGKWGYRIIGHHAWATTNYESVVMRLDLGRCPRPPAIGTYRQQPAACQPWDPRSIAVAQRLATLIAAACPEAAVAHVGSTAVPGCDGKGVIDLLVDYGPAGLERARAALDGLGFQRQSSADPFPEERPMRVGEFVHDGVGFRVHAHVVAAGSAEALELVAFRDALRADPALLAAYVTEKRAVIAAGISDPAGYSRTKAGFIRRWLAAAGSPPQ
jgi:GrpB-like predicted nucleotidyltransferase (UPF0157 family)/GNAT superfamily N-acetyltransferase